MSVFDWIRQLAPKPATPAEVRDANRTLSPIFVRMYSNLGVNRPDIDLATRALYRLVPWVYACINVIANTLITVPLEVRRGRTPYSKEYEVIEEGPAYDLIYPYPNQTMTMQELLFLTICDTHLSAGSFWLIEPTVPSEPLELWRLDPSYVRIVPDMKTVIGGYRYNPGGVDRFFSIDEVVYVRLPNPEDMLNGFSRVTPAKASANLNNHVIQFHRDFFKNCPVTGMALQMAGELGEKQRAEMKASIKDVYTGEGRFDPMLLENDLKPVDLLPSLVDLGFEQITEKSIEAVLATLQVPPALVGLLKYATYNNISQQKAILFENSVIPTANVIQSAMNLVIPRRFGLTDLWYVFNFQAVDALQENRKDRTDRAVGLYKATLITRNEARETAGYPPLDDVTGDEFFTPSTNPFENLSAVSSDGVGARDGATGGQLDASPPADSAPLALLVQQRSLRLPAGASKDDHTRSYRRKVERAQRHYVGLMKTFFKGQKERTLERFDRMTNNAKMFSPLLMYVRQDRIPDQDIDRLFPLDAEDLALTKATQPYTYGIVRDEMSDVFEGLSIEGSFSVTNPEVAKLIGKLENKLRQINRSTWEYIKSTIEVGYENGWTTKEIRTALAEQFDSWYKPGKGELGVEKRTMLIARTEMPKAVHGGQDAAYRQAMKLGLKFRKRWLHAHTDNPRENHLAADGQEVEYDEPFDLGSSFLMFPHDPEGEAGEVCNCQCDWRVIQVTDHGDEDE